MGGRADVVRRLLLFLAGLWVLRWAAMEVASYAGRHWLPPSRPAKDSPRPPGWMPGPFDD
jgi:hypothetical protein